MDKRKRRRNLRHLASVPPPLPRAMPIAAPLRAALHQSQTHPPRQNPRSGKLANEHETNYHIANPPSLRSPSFCRGTSSTWTPPPALPDAGPTVIAYAQRTCEHAAEAPWPHDQPTEKRPSIDQAFECEHICSKHCCYPRAAAAARQRAVSQLLTRSWLYWRGNKAQPSVVSAPSRGPLTSQSRFYFSNTLSSCFSTHASRTTKKRHTDSLTAMTLARAASATNQPADKV